MPEDTPPTTALTARSQNRALVGLNGFNGNGPIDDRDAEPEHSGVTFAHRLWSRSSFWSMGFN
jgi:hypothetical protein